MRILTALAISGLLVSSAASAVTITYTTNLNPGAAPQDPTTGTIAVDDFNAQDAISQQNAQGHQLGSGSCARHATGLSSSSIGIYQDFGYANDSVLNQRLNPQGTGSNSCYLTVGATYGAGGGFSAGSTGTDITNPSIGMIDTGAGPNSTTYIGFYWGSVDSYNYIQITANDGSTLLTLPGAGAIAGETDTTILTGSDVAKASGIAVNAAQGIYINLFFTQADAAETVTIGNTAFNAFELTNFASSSDPVIPITPTNVSALNSLAVPEPGAAFALASGLGLLGLARRKRA